MNVLPQSRSSWRAVEAGLANRQKHVRGRLSGRVRTARYIALAMSAGSGELRVVTSRDGWTLAGSGSFVQLVNEFLGYRSDRNYSARMATIAQSSSDLIIPHLPGELSG
jgi:hypothetical protein